MINYRVPIVCLAVLSGGVATGCNNDEDKPDEEHLEPGHYLPPLVELQRLQGEEDHMHVPGCLHLAWDEDDPNLVYTSHRGNIDPRATIRRRSRSGTGSS
jgi:hypothetical protein